MYLKIERRELYRIGGGRRCGRWPRRAGFAFLSPGHWGIGWWQLFGRDNFKFWDNARRSSDAADEQIDLQSGRLGADSFEFQHDGGRLEGRRKGHWYICQIKAAGRIIGNPVAAIFAQRLVAEEEQHIEVPT